MESAVAWIEVNVDAAQDAVDWARMFLAEHGYTDDVIIRKRPAATGQPHDQAKAQRPFHLQFYIWQDTRAEVLLHKLDQGLAPLRRADLIGDLLVHEVAHKPAHLQTQRDQAHRIGQHLLVVPPGSEGSITADDVAIHMAPSAAFGTGLHPATQLCLELLEASVAAEMHTLDLGCGSGILTVAMARMGARVLALDNDPLAVEATRRNVASNDLTHAVTVVQGSLGRGAELGHWMGWTTSGRVQAIEGANAFDLITANILARIHLTLAGDYRRALRTKDGRRGVLITAGFTLDYEEVVTRALEEAGLEGVDRRQMDEWVALAHSAPV
jgi:ribosomal protein L11 methyltransferase